MIVTLTLNPSVDRTVEVERLARGEVMRGDVIEAASRLRDLGAGTVLASLGARPDPSSSSRARTIRASRALDMRA